MENKRLIDEIEKNTSLLYLEVLEEGNLCFRQNNSDLQNDFKEVFTKVDLNLYIKSFGEAEVLAPKNAEEFWDKVNLGKQMIGEL